MITAHCNTPRIIEDCNTTIGISHQYLTGFFNLENTYKKKTDIN